MSETSKRIRIVKILKQIRETIKQNMNGHFKDINVTGPQGMLLGTLAHYGEMKISDLSKKLGLSNSTVSGIVDRLERHELVERVRSKKDRRVVYVNVTERFKKIAHEHFHHVERMLDEMMNEASTEEIDTILEGLETLQKVINRQNQNNSMLPQKEEMP